MKPEDKATNDAVHKFASDYLPTSEEGKTLIIRTGAAPKLLDELKPQKVHINGVIAAPRMFYEKRKQLHNPDKSHVLYDKNAGTIILVVNEQFPEDNYNIKGTIRPNPDLAPFKINGGKSSTFDVKSLMEVLKFNRAFFVDKDENAKIVLALQNFKAKIEHAIEESGDNRGAENSTKITKMEHDLQESFELCMPIHKGGNNCTFKVEILCRVRDRAVEVWLESRELKEMEMTSIDKIMKDELAAFTEIVCIEQ